MDPGQIGISDVVDDNVRNKEGFVATRAGMPAEACWRPSCVLGLDPFRERLHGESEAVPEARS